MFVDTHAHLQWASFDHDREAVLDRARTVNVSPIVIIGFDLEGSHRAVELAAQHPDLYAAIGFHPHNATHLTPSSLDALRTLAQNSKVIAIGEVGLDFYRTLSPKDVQQQAFETQLQLAAELALPVIIHDRDAHKPTMNTLEKFAGNQRVVLHCFSGSKEMAVQCENAGFYLSFAGPVTFPNARNLHEIVQQVNLNQILLETDSPWLAPQAKRGQRNEPAFLPFIAQKIADLKEISMNDVAKATTTTARAIFKLP